MGRKSCGKPNNLLPPLIARLSNLYKHVPETFDFGLQSCQPCRYFQRSLWVTTVLLRDYHWKRIDFSAFGI